MRAVLLTGFESFNADLYRQAARLVAAACPELELVVYCDRDISERPQAVAAALAGASAFLGSLLFDYRQVQWLNARLGAIPQRLVFESALELMGQTQLGGFRLGQSKGMPGPVRALLDKFGSGREEDRLAGYLGFLKAGPKFLKFVPGAKARDLRLWLTLYGYWSAGGAQNVAHLFLLLAREYLGARIGPVPEAVPTPDTGLLHPEYTGFFADPSGYLTWYDRHYPERGNWPRVAVLLYRKHVVSKLPYILQLLRRLEACGLRTVPIFVTGVEGHQVVRDWLCGPDESVAPGVARVDAVVSTLGFPLVGGPAGTMEAGRRVEAAVRILERRDVPYLVSAPLLIQDIRSWYRQGVGGLQSVVLYALPELDGAIDPVALGGLVGEQIYLVPERVDRLAGRLQRWVHLRRTPPSRRRVAVIVYGFPPGYGATGTAALLNVPASLVAFLQALAAQGYDLGGAVPTDGEALIARLRQAEQTAQPESAVSPSQLQRWLGYRKSRRIEKHWGALERGDIGFDGRAYGLAGIRLGNVWIGVQPALGILGDPMRLLFEKDLTPHPQYAAFYLWLQREFRADALVHFGMHGTFEWLPGTPLGNTGDSWPDAMVGDLPNLYLYAANNPSESILARRRGLGVLVSHNVPPYTRAGLYKELAQIQELLGEYREEPAANRALEPLILQKVRCAGLDVDCPPDETAFERYADTLHRHLQTLAGRLFSSGLHVLGERPTPRQLLTYLDAYLGDRLEGELLEAVARGGGLEQIRQEAILTAQQQECLREACEVRALLLRTTEELTNLLRGLEGRYIPPAPGGDLIRDGAGVLPTGRNIHALDPYRMPSEGAYQRGRQIAESILSEHRATHGSYPETVAVPLWGLDAIKTRGESVGIVLGLIGARPVKELTGRVVAYELLPLAELGRPRIDVLANLSGIFRDSFANVLEILDDVLRLAGAADEPPEANFLRKHTLEFARRGIADPEARLFSNPAGDYGSLVGDQVVTSSWEASAQLADTWRGRNQYAYGRAERGTARPELLEGLLATTGRIIQQIDSVEYGLTDIQEYYANTGALKLAAERAGGKAVGASFIESYARHPEAIELEKLLRLEYRSKLLNPKWAEQMAAAGSGGAFEISQRFTALIGWAATADFRDGWVYDQAAQTYVLDGAMAERLRRANPEAFRNVVGRLLEANGRGFWQADADTLAHLQAQYGLAEDTIEKI
ncbi:cobaltochelatase subunit CobN [Gloeobacter morelensis]|uniref:magnesium chelatase n=1 Tax=Gloeobacter morelensis MG652769 TaxID=2781736 RepID=A0ABY3PMI6_9CYAN|nr:cobaltochelatase subunit CobN [Gloeobacter morelensis]UFP94799.1 cobaltochelatase subunit CobN [Gloeobacter morelensis MG652769]